MSVIGASIKENHLFCCFWSAFLSKEATVTCLWLCQGLLGSRSVRTLVPSVTHMSQSVLSGYNISTFPSDSKSIRCVLCFYKLQAVLLCHITEQGTKEALISWSAIKFLGHSFAVSRLQHNEGLTRCAHRPFPQVPPLRGERGMGDFWPHSGHRPGKVQDRPLVEAGSPG